MPCVWPRSGLTRSALARSALAWFCHNVADRAVREPAALRCGTGAAGAALGHCLAKTGGFAMKPIGTIAIGLTLVAGAAGAQAQTAVTRQITSEPVETVVTQGPNGTAVTRRILTPEPGFTTYATPQFQ